MLPLVQPPPRTILRAGSAYFAIVFALGFLLGVVRTLVLVPRLGEAAAVGLELPVLLAFAWPVCGWLVARLRVPPTLRARLGMGGYALLWLMTAELGLAVLALGRTPGEHFAHYRSLPAALGLAGQLLFALFPLLRLPRERA